MPGNDGWPLPSPSVVPGLTPEEPSKALMRNGMLLREGGSRTLSRVWSRSRMRVCSKATLYRVWEQATACRVPRCKTTRTRKAEEYQERQIRGD